MKKSRDHGIYNSVPESLASLLLAIRERIFRLGKASFSEHLNDVRREPNLSTKYRPDVVGEIESRSRILDFEHMETYARTLGLPTCVLSFVSRYQRMPLDEAKLVAEEMLKITELALRERRTRLTAHDLHVLAEQINLEIPRRPALPPSGNTLKTMVEAFEEQAAKTDLPEKDAQDLPLFGSNEEH